MANRSLTMRFGIVLALLSSPLPPLFASPARAAEPAPVDPARRFAELSAKAEAAYKASRHQDAIDAYLEAFGLIPNAEILYNVAYIYDRHLLQRDLAMDFYRRVVRTPDSSPDITALAVKRLAELDAQTRPIEPNPPLPGPTGPTPTGPGGVNAGATRDDGPGVAPWVLVAVGGGALVTGIVFGALAAGTNSDYDLEVDLQRKRALESDGRTQALSSDILTISGGLLVVSGLIWYFVADGSSPATPKSAQQPMFRPVVTSDGFGLTVGGAW